MVELLKQASSIIKYGVLFSDFLNFHVQLP